MRAARRFPAFRPSFHEARRLLRADAMMRRAIFLLLAVGACGGSVASQGPSSDFDVDAGEGPPPVLGPDGGGADAGTIRVDAPPDVYVDPTPDARPDVVSACAPKDVPSQQTVHLVVTNASGADRYLVTAGNFCDPYAVSFSHQAAMPLSLGFQCLCECPNPGPARAAALHRLAPGESFSLSWDARSLSTCNQPWDCGANGWPGGGIQNQIVGASRPVGPGDYSVSVGALTSVPQACSSADGTTYDCPMGFGGPPPGPFPGPIATMCPADVSAVGGFVLPAAGNVDVAIAIAQ
jgi:hypothetical protein